MGQGILTPAPKIPDSRRLIHFATDNIAPPIAMYISVDDQLYWQVVSSIAGEAVTLSIRYLDPSGNIVPQVETITTLGNRTAQSLVIKPQEGYIISAAALGTGGEVYGQIYTRLALLKNISSSQLFNAGVMFSGYLGLNFLGWPNGPNVDSTQVRGALRSITGTSPAAGAEISETVPSAASWNLNSFRFGLTTSATVANRYPKLIIDDGTNILYQIDGAALIAAGVTRNFDFGGGMTFRSSPQGVDDNYPLPVPFFLRAGYRIRTSTSNLQAGDQYTAPQYQAIEVLGG